MKKAVITGGTGMIGCALAEYLLQKEIEVTILARPDSKRTASLPKDKRLKIMSCDLSKLAEAKLPDKEYDVFFHLGWNGTSGDCRNDMLLQNKNTEYALEAVKLAHRLGCKAFLGAGSQAEYGRYEGKLSADVPAFPENGYGMAKLCAGQMSRIMAQGYGMKHIWMRILSVYGPYDGESTMIMSSIIKMLAGESPEYTPAGQIWDYLYCKDAARAFYSAAEKGADGAVYCLGSGKAKALREYIEIMRDMINPQIELKFGAKPYADKQVMYLCADISNLQRDTGFEPEYEFCGGIKETIEWCRRNIQKSGNN